MKWHNLANCAQPCDEGKMTKKLTQNICSSNAHITNEPRLERMPCNSLQVDLTSVYQRSLWTIPLPSNLWNPRGKVCYVSVVSRVTAKQLTPFMAENLKASRVYRTRKMKTLHYNGNKLLPNNVTKQTTVSPSNSDPLLVGLLSLSVEERGKRSTQDLSISSSISTSFFLHYSLAKSLLASNSFTATMASCTPV